MQQCMYKTKICDIDGPEKLPDANLVWLWTERYQGCNWPVERPFEIMCALLVAEALNTCYEIIVHLYYVVHQNILWNCQCKLVHFVTML